MEHAPKQAVILNTTCGCKFTLECSLHRAAPALLSALEEVILHFDDEYGGCGAGWPPLTQARAAILATKGEAND